MYLETQWYRILFIGRQGPDHAQTCPWQPAIRDCISDKQCDDVTEVCLRGPLKNLLGKVLQLKKV